MIKTVGINLQKSQCLREFLVSFSMFSFLDLFAWWGVDFLEQLKGFSASQEIFILHWLWKLLGVLTMLVVYSSPFCFKAYTNNPGMD